MKISSYQVQVASVPYEATRRATHVILQLRTHDGIEGVGYTTFATAQAWMAKPFVPALETLLELVVGQDPLRNEAICAKLLERANGTLAGLISSAASVIDVALWDIKGKALGQPVYALLGGFRDRVPAYGSWQLWWQNDLDTLAKNAQDIVQRGFKAMKFRLGGMKSVKEAVERTRVMREVVGPNVDLMADANQSWTANQAMQIGRELEQFSLAWLEDPVSHLDYVGLKRISEALDTPVCAGETYHSSGPFRDLLQQGAIDIAMIDLDVGGFTQWLKVAHLAEIHGLPVVSHLATEALAHAVAAIPNGMTVEYNPWAVPLFKEVPPLEDGQLVLSHKPGLSLELDQTAIEHHRVA